MSKSDRQTILVTGASGQLGRKLVPALLNRGYSIRAHFRSEEKSKRWCPSGVTPVYGDMRNLNWLDDAIRGCDTVIHCAAKVSLRPGPDKEMEIVNVDGTRAVIKSCLANNIRRLIYISTIVTVGASPDNNPISEAAPFNLGHINTLYIHTKKIAENMAMEANGPRLETITLNPSIMISIPDRELTKGDLKKFPRWVPIYFDFGLNLVETDDVIDGIIAAVDKGTPGQRYLLTGDNIDTARAVNLAAKYLNIGRPFLKIPRWLLFPAAWIVELRAKIRGKRPSFHRGLAKLAYYRFYYSNEKAKKDLGYNPKPLEDTIVRIIHALKSRNDFRP